MNIIEQYRNYRKAKLKANMLPILDEYFRGATGTDIKEWQKDKRQELQAMEYRVWFEGKQEKIEWFYKEYMVNAADQYTLTYRDNPFWKVVKSDSVKLHFPLASMISETMANLLFHEKPQIRIEHTSDKETEILTDIITETLKENNADLLLQKGAQLESYSGTLAARVILDTNFAELPIIKFHPSSEFELVSEYGRVIEIVFNDVYKHGKNKYILKSYYGKGYVKYRLFNDRKKEVPLATVPELAALKNFMIVDKDGNPIKLLLAAYKVNRPCDNEFIDSNYGESDYGSLIDIFQAIDETYSAIIDRIRKGHIVTFVSEDLTKVDERTGTVKKIDDYQLKSVVLNGNPDPNLKSTLDRSIPNIDISGLYESLQQMIRNALSRVGLSPNTVIEVLGGANASAQALEIREGVSARTRDAKAALWETFIKQLSRLVLVFYSLREADITESTDTAIIYKVDDTGDEYEYKCVFAPFEPETWQDRLPLIKEALDANLISHIEALRQLWQENYTEDELQEMQQVINGIITDE